MFQKYQFIGLNWSKQNDLINNFLNELIVIRIQGKSGDGFKFLALLLHAMLPEIIVKSSEDLFIGNVVYDDPGVLQYFVCKLAPIPS